jgi:ABC-2 type transport system permease protein
LTSLGLIIAWRMQSTQGFHAIMSLVLMPLWLLSGAFFPVPQIGVEASLLERAMSLAMQLNPMTYGVAGLRQLLFPNLPAEALGLPSLATCWFVTVAFAVVTFAGAWIIAGRRTVGDAR